MRKVILFTFAAGTVAASAGVASAQSTTDRGERARRERDSSQVQEGRRHGRGEWRGNHRGGPGTMMGVRGLRALPETLALSVDQQSRIRSLTDAFRQTHKADLDAIAAAGRKAREARKAGESREQVRRLFEETAPARDRLRTAGAELRRQVEGVLTTEQREWLAAREKERAAKGPRRSRG